MKRILIVDDDEAILDSLEMVLSDTYEVLVARGGAEALAKVASVSLDAIVLDMMMPEVDGPAVLAALAKGTRHPPVIVLSAARNVWSALQGLPVFEMLRKPVNLEVLEASLVRAIAAGPVGGGPASPPDGAGGKSGAGGPGSPHSARERRNSALAELAALWSLSRGARVKDRGARFL